GDFSGNAAKIIDFAHQAQAAGAGLILFPELSVCGYPPRDLVERTSSVTHNRETAERIAVETRGIAVVCGLVTPAQAETGKSVMNSAALLKDGKLEFRRNMLATIAKNYKVPVVMVNQVGGNDSLVFDGSSVVLNSAGDVIAQGKSFEEDIVYFDSDQLTGEIHEQIAGEEASAY